MALSGACIGITQYYNPTSNCPATDGCPDGVCPDITIKRYDTTPAFRVSISTCDGSLDLTDPSLLLEINMWAKTKLKKAILATDTTLQFAGNVAFNQIFVGDLLFFQRVRNPEYMQVVSIDEDTNIITVSRGVNGTTASAWKKNSGIVIYRVSNSAGHIETITGDIIGEDGSTQHDQVLDTNLVYQWAKNDTTLPGCFWLEFKLLKLVELPSKTFGNFVNILQYNTGSGPLLLTSTINIIDDSFVYPNSSFELMPMTGGGGDYFSLHDPSFGFEAEKRRLRREIHEIQEADAFAKQNLQGEVGSGSFSLPTDLRTLQEKQAQLDAIESYLTLHAIATTTGIAAPTPTIHYETAMHGGVTLAAECDPAVSNLEIMVGGHGMGVGGQASFVSSGYEYNPEFGMSFGGSPYPALEMTGGPNFGGQADVELAIDYPGNLIITSGEIYFGGSQVGQFTAGNESTPLLISFNSLATRKIVQSVLQNIIYVNVLSAPPLWLRTVTYQLTGGDGAISDVATIDIGMNVMPNVQALEGIEWIRRFPSDSEGFLVKIVDTSTFET